jgi:energy-coupling factor transport system substrate-specific component
MLDLIAMWKNPKMVAYLLLTAILYPALLYPFQQFSLFATHADYLRIAMGIPAAFSFLFGPAAAWGTAFGNLIYDAATGLTIASIFGFIGNFLIAYIPYKLWSVLTTEKPDLRSIKKIGLFAAISALACIICGLVVGWGLFYVYNLPFVMTSVTIIATDALWAILFGSILSAVCYGFVSRNKGLYTDVMGVFTKSNLNRHRQVAMALFFVTAVLCFAIPMLFSVDALVLLPFVLVAVVSTIVACKEYI